jgi:hypothetical protein
MGRRSREEGACRQRMGTSSLQTRSDEPDMQSTWGLNRKCWTKTSARGIRRKECMRTEEPEAREPSRLSKVVVESNGHGPG